MAVFPRRAHLVTSVPPRPALGSPFGPASGSRFMSTRFPTAPTCTHAFSQNGSATFVRRDRTSSSTDRDCVTSYYESFSLEEIHTPPDLSDDPQLEEGDVYINTVYDSGASQMWIWTKDGGKLAFWKAAREGDIREDGRTSVKPTISECLDVLDSHSSRRSDIFRSRHSGAYPFDLILHLLALLSQSHMLATHIFACFRNI